jgi:hypothetical protein
MWRKQNVYKFRRAFRYWFRLIILNQNYTVNGLYYQLYCCYQQYHKAPWDEALNYFTHYPNATLTQFLNGEDPDE